MDPLIEGYRRFRAEVWPAERARYEALAHWGQSPEAMVIACSDSRVDPQTIFGAAPGELFVVRNVAAPHMKAYSEKTKDLVAKRTIHVLSAIE